MNICCVIIIAFLTAFVKASNIVFPSSHTTRTDACYLPQHNVGGICSLPQHCKLYNVLSTHNKYSDILCRGDTKMICCPQKLDLKATNQFDISRPTSAHEGCGSTLDIGNGFPLSIFYRANKTADDLKEQGFTITHHDMYYEDRLRDFRFSNSTYNGTFIYDFGEIRFAIGGQNSRYIVTVYVALLGKRSIRDPNSIEWLCDGALINFEWVLTAAHCFSRDLDVVRLGEYNLTVSNEFQREDPQDYGIKKLVLYPKYSFPAAYHDLALVQLSRRTYVARPDINPVCLPWGDEADVPLLNKQITLTGWGATFFGGPTAEVAQEVNVTVFDVNKCEKGYSTLRDYAEKFPSGMHSPTILCAGDEAGGKDACQGDSGGPVVYLNSAGKYTLAGIVATGHGCGLKEFPGIYTPIAIPEYLDWIKAIAFPTD